MSADKPFNATMLHVWSRDPVKRYMLEHAKVEQLGDRSFIVGQLAEGPAPHARAGLTIWLPISEVLTLTEYPNRERALAAWREWQKERKKKDQNAKKPDSN